MGAKRYKDLVLITLDCVRPDFLGCYGSLRARTPNLDRLAAKGVVFEQAMSQAPNTWVSHAGILTGLYPPLHGLRGPFDRIDPGVPTLAVLLSEYGYRCAGFPGNDLVGSRMGFGTGFDLYYENYRMEGPGHERAEGVHANNRNRWEEVLEAAGGWLSGRKGPVFLWFHYLDTHHLPECDLPEYYRRGSDPCWQFYEGKISYADERCVQGVLDLLARHGRYEDALVVILADHGEELLPASPPAHNGRLTEAVLRVPLILFGEAVPWKGLRLSGLVRTVDLVPTLVAGGLLGLPGIPPEGLRDRFSGALLPLPGPGGDWRLRPLGPGRDLAYAENAPLGFFSIRSQEWKYVVGPGEERLVHLPSDPAERGNRLEEHPSLAAYLREELQGIRSSGTGKASVPAEREEEETQRLLRAFGYLE